MDFIDEAQRIAWNAKMKEYRKEQKKEELKRKVAAIGNMVCEYAPAVLALTPAAIAVTRTVTNVVGTVGRVVEQSDERNRRKHKCYDRSEGHYWNLKRELTNSDWAVITERKRNGERLGDILKDMKILK